MQVLLELDQRSKLQKLMSIGTKKRLFHAEKVKPAPSEFTQFFIGHT